MMTSYKVTISQSKYLLWLVILQLYIEFSTIREMDIHIVFFLMQNSHLLYNMYNELRSRTK